MSTVVLDPRIHHARRDSVVGVLRSEWTKIRTVSSTLWTLACAFVVTAALGALICLLVANNFDSMSAAEKVTFDATSTSFAGMGLGQLALIVFGVLVVGSEYSTGMIRTSLAAVPRRGTFLACKLAAAAALALVVAVVTSFVTFLLGQAMLGEEHRTSLSEPGVLRAVIGAALYMTLLVLFAAGVATLLRQPVLAMGVLVPFFFMISSILVAIPATKEVARYLPDQAGQQVMIVTAQENAPAYGPWGGLGIMALWTAVAVGVGYVALLKRDA